MLLREYLEKYQIKPRLFAERCGISLRSVRNYMSGGRPVRIIAERIEKETGGRVTIEELRGQDG